MKAKLFNLFLIVCFLGIGIQAHAQSVVTTGPGTFLSSAWHAVLKGTGTVLDFAEEYIANPVIKADYYVDEANGENPDAVVQAKLAKSAAKKQAKAQAKAAKAAAKAAKATKK